MKYEIITMLNTKVIGMSKEIAFNNPSECARFWGEYVERIVRPVYIEGQTPDEFLEWYCGADISSPDYKCGIMMPLAD